MLDKKEEIELIKKLSDFPGIVEKASNELRPSVIASYAYELAKQFNEFYHIYNILKEKEDIKNARLLLVSCIRQVLKNSLSLLGIDVLERM